MFSCSAVLDTYLVAEACRNVFPENSGEQFESMSRMRNSWPGSTCSPADSEDDPFSRKPEPDEVQLAQEEAQQCQADDEEAHNTADEVIEGELSDIMWESLVVSEDSEDAEDADREPSLERPPLPPTFGSGAQRPSKFDGKWVICNREAKLSKWLDTLTIEGDFVIDGKGDVCQIVHTRKGAKLSGGILKRKGSSLVRIGKSGRVQVFLRPTI